MKFMRGKYKRICLALLVAAAAILPLSAHEYFPSLTLSYGPMFESKWWTGADISASIFFEKDSGAKELVTTTPELDRLKAEMDARTVVRQPMLVPYILTVNAQERTFLSDHLGEVEAIGFDAEEFGGTSFKISAVPLDLQDIDLGAFFADLFTEVGSLRGIRLSELLRDRIAMTACKHAVKGGMLLTDSEKEKLFSMLHGDLGLKCPHGRPVCIRLTKTEIEKMFKRIV